MLVDAGIPVGCQTVLLKGVNDDVDVMKELMRKLLMIRVRPYYIYQADLTKGTNYFRTRVEKGLEIIDGLRGHTSGLAVPHYVIDAPGGGGKIPLLPEYVTEVNDTEVVLRNYAGRTYRYPQVTGEPGVGVTVGTDGSVGSDGTTTRISSIRRVPEPIAHLD
jgi:lysine 2,3-aminomutase